VKARALLVLLLALTLAACGVKNDLLPPGSQTQPEDETDPSRPQQPQQPLGQ
jgi:predicted small lipoprotein YifL